MAQSSGSWNSRNTKLDCVYFPTCTSKSWVFAIVQPVLSLRLFNKLGPCDSMAESPRQFFKFFLSPPACIIHHEWSTLYSQSAATDDQFGSAAPRFPSNSSTVPIHISNVAAIALPAAGSFHISRWRPHLTGLQTTLGLQIDQLPIGIRVVRGTVGHGGFASIIRAAADGAVSARGDSLTVRKIEHTKLVLRKAMEGPGAWMGLVFGPNWRSPRNAVRNGILYCMTQACVAQVVSICINHQKYILISHEFS